MPPTRGRDEPREQARPRRDRLAPPAASRASSEASRESRDRRPLRTRRRRPEAAGRCCRFPLKAGISRSSKRTVDSRPTRQRARFAPRGCSCLQAAARATAGLSLRSRRAADICAKHAHGFRSRAGLGQRVGSSKRAVDRASGHPLSVTERAPRRGRPADRSNGRPDAASEACPRSSPPAVGSSHRGPAPSPMRRSDLRA
jgi:hypothetical protein